jgi:glucosylceramidase
MASTALDNVPNVAFKTPDGNLVTILQNKEAAAKTIEIQLGETVVFVEMPAKSIGTLVYKDPNKS